MKYTYNFFNLETKKDEEIRMEESELENFTKLNPNLKFLGVKLYCTVGKHDKVRQNVAFQERLKQIHDNTYGSTLDTSKAFNTKYFGGD